MSTPDDPETEQDKKPHPNAVHFTVDGEPLEIETNSLTMSEILALVGKKADQWYLVEEAGGEQREFRHPDEEVTVSDHSDFVAEEKHHPVTVTVNTKAVELPARHVTGLEIKEAAIAQGVEIKLDFELTWEAHDGEPDQNVTDAQKITVNKHSVFSAVDNEEDS
jgi:hypothetical protein